MCISDQDFQLILLPFYTFEDANQSAHFTHTECLLLFFCENSWGKSVQISSRKFEKEILRLYLSTLSVRSLWKIITQLKVFISMLTA